MHKFLASLFGWRRKENNPYGPQSPWPSIIRSKPLPPMFYKALALHIYYATEETAEQSRSYFGSWIGL